MKYSDVFRRDKTVIDFVMDEFVSRVGGVVSDRDLIIDLVVHFPICAFGFGNESHGDPT